MHISYYCRSLNALDGSSQAARNILLSLLCTSLEINIITSQKCYIPTHLNETPLSVPRWTIYRPKINIFIKMLINKTSSSLNNIRIFKIFNKLFYYTTNKKTGLYLVQGLGSHTFFLNNCSRVGIKTAIIVQESPRHFISNRNYTLQWALEALSKYDFLIFVSLNCQKEWISFDELISKESFYIPNCCDEVSINSLLKYSKTEVKKNLGIPNNKFIVSCIASIQPRKNQEIIIRILPRIIKNYPKVHIYFIGPRAVNYKWADNIIDKIKNGEYSPNMTYLGAIENAKEYIYASDLLILPSLAEAMPLVILEAMALRTPVAASNVDGIPEIIEDDKSGLLFSPLDEDDIVNTFTQLLSNPDKADRYRTKAYERYWTFFSSSNQISKYKNFLNKVLDANNYIN